ncbi:MAG TPA: inositol monophosphatase family protein [Candidatus Andersenbacteria bacterium]|nr:inositol monophosphatase family protein [Candidatus Andersenbacteria bacterium]
MATPFGDLNGHAVGIIMKEMVRRAIEVIRAQRHVFEATEKETIGKTEDFVTSADTAAQQVYVQVIRQSFPNFGIIAEEDHLAVPCTHPILNIYISVDPLDGTKAFIRRQSHGIGTMLALSINGQVIAAFVGDIMTQEIFGFRPESEHVYRISEYGKAERLVVDSTRLLSNQYLLLRDMPTSYTLPVQNLATPQDLGGLFKSTEVSGGSIGISMARLWKGEVAAIVLHGTHDTPWDTWPIIGISQKMGFVFMQLTSSGKFEQYEPDIRLQTFHRPYEVLVIHKSRLNDLLRWQQTK